MGIPSWVEDLSAIRMHWIAQNKALTAIRKLHKPYQPDLLSPNHLMCEECSGINNGGYPALFVRYPCPTIKALDGEQ